MPAVSLVGFRVSITAAALIIVQAFRRRLWLHDRSDYWRLGVLSLFGVTLNQLLFIGGLSRTKASNTSLLAVTIPIFTLAVGAILGTEKLTLAKFAGIALAAVRGHSSDRSAKCFLFIANYTGRHDDHPEFIVIRDLCRHFEKRDNQKRRFSFDDVGVYLCEPCLRSAWYRFPVNG